MIRKFAFIPLAALLPAIVLLLALRQSSQAATPQLGCNPLALTVKTGQTFYITVAVTDTTDLYAWQMDATYNHDFLEFVSIAPGNHLCQDGALYYKVTPTVVPGSTTDEMRLAVYTRLSKHTGVDGNGSIAHIYFRALSQNLGGTNVTLNDTKLVDRNALEISKSLVNSGRCKVIISDTAPELEQDPVGELIFLPMTLR
jgi:hypothetical protein